MAKDNSAAGFNAGQIIVELARLLAKHPQGLDRGKLTTVHSSGGGLTRTLEELSEAAFITPVRPFGKKTKETIYRLSDEYSLFYLRCFILLKRTI